jgi:uncharacterized protein (TIRG00374 family)
MQKRLDKLISSIGWAWGTLIPPLIAIGILGLLISSINYQQFISLLANADISLILLACVCYFLNNILVVYRAKKILFELGVNVRWKGIFFSHMAGMLLSDFTPARSGYLYTAAALNKRDVPMEKGMAAITSTYLYDLTFKVIIAIIGMFFLYSFIFADRLGWAIIMTIILVITIITGYFIIMHPGERLKKIFGKWSLTKSLLLFGEQGRLIQKHVPYIITITFVGWLFRGLEWYLIAYALQKAVLSPLNALLLNPFLTLFSLIPFTPAGWGIQEASIMFVFNAIGISAAFAVSFALIVRVSEIAVDMVGIKELLIKPQKTDDLTKFYNSIEGDADEKAYSSDMLVQKYFQRRKTDDIKEVLAIKISDTILDIGCGSGVQIREVGKNGYAFAVGIDINENAVRFARKKGLPNTEFIIGDAQHIPIKTGSADKLICAEIIEHLKEPGQLVAEINRVLKPGGSVVITTPNDRSIWGAYELMWDLFGRGRSYGKTHLRFFSEDMLRNYFAQFQEFRSRTLFFISPIFALTGSVRVLEIGKRIDTVFEKYGLGVSVIMYARK